MSLTKLLTVVRRLFRSPTPSAALDFKAVKERDLIKQFWLSPSTVVDDLINHLENGPSFTGDSSEMRSCSGLIRVCPDFYGMEVTIRPCHLLLDCVPSAYGLQRGDAMRLYEVILTRVPGSSSYRLTPVEV